MRPMLLAAALTAGVVTFASCGRERAVLELEGGGDSREGPELIRQYGCGSCHEIPGVRGANADVAPPLSDFSQRAYIAGQLPNTPDNMVTWIMDPQAVAPGTAMPDLGVSEEDARHIAAYLATLGR